MAKKYEELIISDDFMYGKVSQDLSITKEILEMAIDKEISGIEFADNQKTLKGTIEGKEVRLDSYVEDAEKNIYDSEMQNRSSENTKKDPQLPKRSRYYQGMIDTNLLEGGAKYQNLKKSYIIFFCTFDPFDKGLCKYTFENVCQELPELKLGDDCMKIFFNSKGRDYNNLTEKQIAFIEYIENGKASDELTQRIDAKVRDVRENKKWRREYMKALLHDQDIRDEVTAELTSEFEEIIADKDAEIAANKAELADKDAEIADKDAEIERLKSLLLMKK